MYKLSPWESLFFPRLFITTTLSIYLSSFIYIYLSVYLSFYIHPYASSRPWREVRDADLSKFYLLFLLYTTIQRKMAIQHQALHPQSHATNLQPSFFVSLFFVAIGMSVTSTSKKALGRWNLDESSAETSAPNDHMCCVRNGEALRIPWGLYSQHPYDVSWGAYFTWHSE